MMEQMTAKIEASSTTTTMKRSSNGCGANGAKKLKVSDDGGVCDSTTCDSASSNELTTFSSASLVSVLNERRSQKAIFMHGKMHAKDEDAVIILERQPFGTSEAKLAALLSSETRLTCEMKNDIYATYSAIPPPELCAVKAIVICPATQKHIDKYRKVDMTLFQETADDYSNITKPYLEQQIASNVFNLQWVYNILEHKAEVDRIIYEDPDPTHGFVFLMDLKWNGEDADSLYCMALPNRRDVKSIRDLTSDHVELLERIESKCYEALFNRFGIARDRVRAYFHYQPSYYHIHVHFTHIELDMGGQDAWRAHLLGDVIDNLKLCSDYYAKKSLLFMLKENDKLALEFKKKKNST